MAGKHAIYSPSGFQALMLCPAKPAMERGLPDESSEYADEGTAAHFLGAACLATGDQASDFLGIRITVSHDGTCAFHPEDADARAHLRYFTVDADFAGHVQTYIDLVREYHLGDGELFVEQPLPIDHVTGEQDAEGTGDAVIVRDGELIVIDLKFGRGVEVSAEDNPQLKLYALGALRKYDLIGDIERVVMVICQPRAGGVSESTCTVAELQAWADDVARPAVKHSRWIMSMVHADGANPINWCKPHEDACRFCKAKPCAAMDAAVSSALQREFTDLTTASDPEREAIVETAVATADAAGDIGARMDAVPLVEMWCKAVRAKVESHLLAGREVAGYKLVAGRKGARAWADEKQAEELLRKTFRLKVEQAYDLKLISPTSAEKLLKDKPRRWAKAQALITQNDGKPSVAPITDKRPALEIQPIAAEFTPITDSPATADDLV